MKHNIKLADIETSAGIALNLASQQNMFEIAALNDSEMISGAEATREAVEGQEYANQMSRCFMKQMVCFFFSFFFFFFF